MSCTSTQAEDTLSTLFLTYTLANKVHFVPYVRMEQIGLTTLSLRRCYVQKLEDVSKTVFHIKKIRYCLVRNRAWQSAVRRGLTVSFLQNADLYCNTSFYNSVHILQPNWTPSAYFIEYRNNFCFLF